MNCSPIVNGSSVEVLEETNEKWVWQCEEGGYEGFVYRHYLAEIRRAPIPRTSR